jgi:two-component system, chemotaxis family, protein-glutamate methylesterase/glutaminase
MANARVLIVDDSLTMRALFSGVLERAKGIEVVGMAANADEARQMMISLKPNVVTLDIEMPGMSGIDFLEEIMRERPTPVIMLSTLTQKGAEISFRALELGAVDCFPKPKSATPEEFNALAPKLAALVLAAAGVGQKKKEKAEAPAAPVAVPTGFDWNGKMVAMSASTGGLEALLHLLPTFPKNCPPTVICLPLDPGFVAPLLRRLKGSCAAEIVLAEDGIPLQQGHVYLATDLTAHVVIDRWPNPSLRLLRSDPVGNFRPSASLLFATVAKTAGPEALGVMLTGMGTDGAAGLKALKGAGGRTIAEDASTCMVDQAPSAARAAGAVDVSLPLDQIGAAIIDGCSKLRNAA